MAYVKKILPLVNVIIMAFIDSSLASAPPLWITKQDPQLMRYVSDDGKMSLFQKPGGSLVLTTNYSVKDILPGQDTDLVLVYSGTGSGLGSGQNNLLFWKREQFLGHYDPNKLGTIYLFDLKTEKVEEITKGVAPQLHLNGQWMSWYLPGPKVLSFLFLPDRDINFQVKLNSKIDPYFIPAVTMINQNQILYTDSNLEDVTGLVLLDRMAQKSEIFYKANSKGQKFELCQNNESIFLGQFSLLDTSPGSAIFQIDKAQPADSSKFTKLYTSEANDLGHLTCQSKIKLYFIKSAPTKDKSWPIYDLYQLDLNTHQVTAKTQWGDITQVISFGGIVLVQRNGKTYLIEGESNSAQDQLGPST